MKILKYTDPDFQQAIDALVNRCDVDLQIEDEAVRNIIQEVRTHGDEALLKFTNRFDKTDYKLEDLRVTPEEIKNAYKELADSELDALKTAAGNIRKFHERQKQESWEYDEEGVTLGQMVRPLHRVGIYVPGGKASYPSSVLMNAIPARVAGVNEIVMCSPAPGNAQSPAALVAADLAGVSVIFKAGGAQAVAAMAYGTPLIPKVDKIVGPGNIYVALAKRMVFGLVDIDMIAGPSEILIIADESARPEFIAADLLSQAEHDEQAVPLLITPSQTMADAVLTELEKQKGRLKRQAIIQESLNKKCKLIVVEHLESAIELANRVAPEHLELAVDDPRRWIKKVTNAGAVFMGHYTPEAIGDYLAGPNHVLPTSGTAKFASPLGVYDFIKRTSLISYTQEALEQAGKTCWTLATLESLDAHAQAVKIRRGKGPDREST